MINIDNRLLDEVDENDLWLLCHIVKRIGTDGSCFPSNRTLCKDTLWNIKRIQRSKKSLIDKGILLITPRAKEKGQQTSNDYKIQTDLVGVYVPGSRIKVTLEGDTPKPDTLPQNGSPYPTPKPDNEVLTRTEVLYSSYNEDVPKSLFPEEEITDKPSEKKKEKVKKEKAPVDPSYPDFVEVWTEEYPILGFDAMSGKMIKSIIAKTQNLVIGRGGIPDRDSMANMFKYIIAYVKRENHFCNGKPLTTWNNQYLSIIHEIYNGKSTGKKQSARDYIDSLKESHRHHG